MPKAGPVAVIGGSISGMLAAREIGSRGFGVDVFEEDLEVGVPDHCGGLVSTHCLLELGISETKNLLMNEVNRALLHSPKNIIIEIDARKQKVIALNRRALDREVAYQAARNNARILVGSRVSDIRQEDGLVHMTTNRSEASYSFGVDARGFSSLELRKGGGILHAAQYEVQGEWFEDDTVELFFDNNFTPGFFTWVIPLGQGIAKVGVAGEAINSFHTLDRFLSSRKSVVLKKLAAPVVVSGPISSFRSENILFVGDAAGQTKPTTGGGIYTGGIGGMLAGQAIAEALKSGKKSELEGYEKRWRQSFDREFKIMSFGRQIFRGLNNGQLDEIFAGVKSSELPMHISEDGHFDFHSISIMEMVGMKNLLKLVPTVLSVGLRSILPKKARSGSKDTRDSQ